MSGDVLARAEAVMAYPLSPAGLRVMQFRSLVPELVAEIERLRWHSKHSGDHVCDECWPDEDDGEWYAKANGLT